MNELKSFNASSLMQIIDLIACSRKIFESQTFKIPRSLDAIIHFIDKLQAQAFFSHKMLLVLVHLLELLAAVGISTYPHHLHGRLLPR